MPPSVLTLLAIVAPLAAAPPSATFHFDLLNRSYENLAPTAERVTQGPLAIDLASPRQVLFVRQNRLELTPRADGSHDARLEVTFLGKGWMVADVALAELTSTRIEDEVLLPIQQQTLRARLEVTRVDGGYQLTARELPSHLEVAIESKAIGTLLGWCRGIALLPGTGAACDELDGALSRVRVPLASAVGRSYLLTDADLRPADREALEAYLLESWNAQVATLPRLPPAGR